MKIKLGLSNGLNVGKLGVMGGGTAPTFTISGTVYDADGTTAIEGATVALGAYNATSIANGTYTISNVPPGTSGSMTCTKSGYSWTAITVSAMAGNLTSQNYINVWWAAGGIATACLGAYRAIGAASLAASYTNLANPGTNDLTAGSAPSFAAATGWTFDGASNYLITGIVPSSGWSMFCRFSNLSAAGNVALCGQRKTANDGMFLFPTSTTNRQYNYGTRPSLTVTASAAGVMGVAGTGCYYNGTSETTTSGTISAQTAAIWIGGMNNAGSLLTPANVKIQAVAIYNTAISSYAILSTAMAALP